MVSFLVVQEMEAGTKQQQFNTDFLIMTETLDGLFKDLLKSFTKQAAKVKKETLNLDNVVSIF